MFSCAKKSGSHIRQVGPHIPANLEILKIFSKNLRFAEIVVQFVYYITRQVGPHIPANLEILKIFSKNLRFAEIVVQFVYYGIRFF